MLHERQMDSVDGCHLTIRTVQRKERPKVKAARWKTRGNIRTSECGDENYRALVDSCFWRALEDQECIRDDAWGGEQASERARDEGIKGSGEVQSMKGLDVKPLRVAIFSTLGRTAAATAAAAVATATTTAAAHP